MDNDRSSQSQPAEVFIRWLWQVVFFLVVFSLCSMLQNQDLLYVREALTPAAIIRLSLWVPTYLFLREQMSVLSRGRRWIVLGVFLLATLAQGRFIPMPGMLGTWVTAADVPLACLGLVWSLRRRNVGACQTRLSQNSETRR